MNPRVNYEMSEADLAMILEACKPTPAMWGSGGTPLFSTPQENANRAWAELGKRMGFDPMTVRSDATVDDPRRDPEGIEHVLVAGVSVVDDGRHTGATPGRALRRGRD